MIIPKLTIAKEQSCQIDLPCENSEDSASSSISSPDNAETSQEKICVYYFYGQGCPHCAKIEPLVKELAGKYPRVELKELEIYHNNTNRQKFLDFNQRFLVKNQGIPTVFIGDQYYVGVDPIKENLEKQINYYLTRSPICPEKVNKNQAKEGGPFGISPISVTFGAVTLAALIDSINPCAFAVLIFLLVYLLAIKAEGRLLKTGLIYILTVYLVYFLSGLGIFAIIQITSFTRIIIKIAAILAIIAGLINIKDFFWPDIGFSLKIPESKKPVLEKYIKQATLPAAIILGFLVSLFELPCTGSIYLAILSLLADRMTKLAAIPYLLYYNLLFVLPLFIILFLVTKGLRPEKLENWRKGSRNWLRLIMGVVILLLGIAMIFEII